MRGPGRREINIPLIAVESDYFYQSKAPCLRFGENHLLKCCFMLLMLLKGEGLYLCRMAFCWSHSCWALRERGRQRERDREGDRERERGGDRERERERERWMGWCCCSP